MLPKERHEYYMQTIQRQFISSNPEQIIKKLGKAELLNLLRKMLLIRNFEIRAESAYQMGKIGGFFHSYMGQEAVQTAAVKAIGKDQWWITSYRCHALALLLGATTDELMAELYGKAAGNAKGRGGSMHFFTDRLLGGFGIVGGQIPIATGAAFTVKYQQKVAALKKEPNVDIAVCFLGDGAVAQGSFHESLNLAALWDLPCLYVIENNQWGMGTHVQRAISVEPMAETKAIGYGMEGYSLDGMDFFNCYEGFCQLFEKIKKTSKPILLEVLTERFRGHSISDPALYRDKSKLQECMKRDPIQIVLKALKTHKILTDEEFEVMDEEQKNQVLNSMKFAEECPWPDPMELEQDVYAP